MLGHYCGSHNGTEVTSTGSDMLVVFSTDGAVTDVGFRIFFWTVDADIDHGGHGGKVIGMCGCVLAKSFL